MKKVYFLSLTIVAHLGAQKAIVEKNFRTNQQQKINQTQKTPASAIFYGALYSSALQTNAKGDFSNRIDTGTVPVKKEETPTKVKSRNVTTRKNDSRNF